MRQAVIVSTARTPLAKSHRGARASSSLPATPRSSPTAGRLPRHGRGRLPARRDGDRPGQRTLGIPGERLNVDGGAISIDHPFGMTRARLAGHLLLEGRRRKARWGVVTRCIAGGMGAAGLFEIF